MASLLRQPGRSPVAWVVLVLLAAGVLFYGAVDDSGPRSVEERARDLGESIKCPRCAGQSVADSDATAARAIRAEINRRVGVGESDEQIQGYFASRYGEDILLTPPRDGIAGLVWFLPVAAFVAALGGLVVVFRRWRTSVLAQASAEDEALVARALER